MLSASGCLLQALRVKPNGPPNPHPVQPPCHLPTWHTQNCYRLTGNPSLITPHSTYMAPKRRRTHAPEHRPFHRQGGRRRRIGNDVSRPFTILHPAAIGEDLVAVPAQVPSLIAPPLLSPLAHFPRKCWLQARSGRTALVVPLAPRDIVQGHNI